MEATTHVVSPDKVLCFRGHEHVVRQIGRSEHKKTCAGNPLSQILENKKKISAVSRTVQKEMGRRLKLKPRKMEGMGILKQHSPDL